MHQEELPLFHLAPSVSISERVDTFKRQERTAKASYGDIRRLSYSGRAGSSPPPNASAKANDASCFRAAAVEKARSSGTVLFERTWLNDIKQRGQDRDVVSARNRHTTGAEPNTNGSVGGRTFGGGGVTKTSLAICAAQVPHGGQDLDGVCVVEASHRGLGVGKSSGGLCKEEVETPLNYPRWHEDDVDVLLMTAWEKAAQDVLRQNAGYGSRKSSMEKFHRPWHLSQWNRFQVKRRSGRKRMRNYYAIY